MLPKVGEIIEGKITGITKFGVFVDMGENRTGMVHISEVARTYVNDIADFVKMGDTVKAKVLTVSEDGKISLSIKRALEDIEGSKPKPKRNRTFTPPKPDNSFVWTSPSNESSSFEDMLKKFQQTSEEKFSELKRKNMDVRRPKRGAASK